jgi:ribonuclease HI
MSSQEDSWTLYFDGSCSQDREAGVGVVLKDSQGQKNCYYKVLDKDLTCNQAEYATLVTSLEIAKGKGVTHLDIKGDSKLIYNQVVGDWKVKADNLKALHHTVEELRSQFVFTSIQHTPRRENVEADKMSRTKTKT